MTKNLWKNEFDRIIGGSGVWTSLVIGAVLAVSHVIMYVLPISDICTDNYPIGVYAKWIGGENSSIQPTLYYLLAPILAVLPYLNTVGEDFCTGYVKNILLYVDRNKYSKVKWLLTFVSGGSCAVFPLLLNFILTAMCLPMILPQPGVGMYPLWSYSLWSELFYSHPGMYVAAYMVLNFVVFGLLATVGLSCSFITQKGYICMLTPFLLYLVIYAATQVTGLHSWCLFATLRPSQPIPANGWILMIEILVLLLSGGVAWVYGWKRKDVF